MTRAKRQRSESANTENMNSGENTGSSQTTTETTETAQTTEQPEVARNEQQSVEIITIEGKFFLPLVFIRNLDVVRNTFHFHTNPILQIQLWNLFKRARL